MSRQSLGQAYDLEQAGRFHDAGELYERLLQRHPNHPALLWGQGRCLMHFKLREAAATVLEQAVRVYPAHEQMVEDVITRLLVLGKPDVALRLSDRGIKDFPENSGIKIQRGDALRVIGRDDEAIAIYRDILERTPGHPGVTLSLVNSLRHNEQMEEALLMARECLADGVVTGLERAGLVNELAQIEDSKGNYQQAFAALIESGEIALDTAQARAVDSEPYLRRVASYQQWVESNGLPVSAPGADSEDDRLVFLLGFSRSGTTLLESMLTAAPGVASSGEAPLIDAALSVIASSGVSIENTLDAMGPENAELLEKARAEYWRKLKVSYGDDFKVFIDKQPMNTLYIAHIRILFPNARIIFCMRDPRDVCLSCFFQWFGVNGTNKLFLDWDATADFYARVMNYWLEVKPLVNDAVCEVRYEELVRDFPGQIRALAASIGIPWDDAILSFAQANQQRFYTTPSNRAVREGVKQDKMQRWKHYPWAFEEVDSALSPLLERLGYA